MEDTDPHSIDINGHRVCLRDVKGHYDAKRSFLKKFTSNDLGMVTFPTPTLI